MLSHNDHVWQYLSALRLVYCRTFVSLKLDFQLNKDFLFGFKLVPYYSFLGKNILHLSSTDVTKVYGIIHSPLYNSAHVLRFINGTFCIFLSFWYNLGISVCRFNIYISVYTVTSLSFAATKYVDLKLINNSYSHFNQPLMHILNNSATPHLKSNTIAEFEKECYVDLRD